MVVRITSVKDLPPEPKTKKIGMVRKKNESDYSFYVRQLKHYVASKPAKAKGKTEDRCMDMRCTSQSYRSGHSEFPHPKSPDIVWFHWGRLLGFKYTGKNPPITSLQQMSDKDILYSYNCLTHTKEREKKLIAIGKKVGFGYEHRTDFVDFEASRKFFDRADVKKIVKADESEFKHLSNDFQVFAYDYVCKSCDKDHPWGGYYSSYKCDAECHLFWSGLDGALKAATDEVKRRGLDSKTKKPSKPKKAVKKVEPKPAVKKPAAKPKPKPIKKPALKKKVVKKVVKAKPKPLVKKKAKKPVKKAKATLKGTKLTAKQTKHLKDFGYFNITRNGKKHRITPSRVKKGIVQR